MSNDHIKEDAINCFTDPPLRLLVELARYGGKLIGG